MTHKTRASRTRRNFWLKAGVWAFIVVFAISVVGFIAIGTFTK